MVALKFSTLSTFAILAAPLMVSAIPFPVIPRALPEGTVRMAFDEVANKLIAFDASENVLGQVNPRFSATPRKRDVGACVNLSSDDVQKLPGWKTIENQANAEWGTGKRNIVTNDKDLPDNPAQMCVDSSPVVVEKDGEPQCTKDSQSTDGQLSETGSVTMGFTQGTTYSYTNTVTKESTVAVGTSVSAKVSFEGLFELTEGLTYTTTFTNTLSQAETITDSSTSASSVTMNTEVGKHCHLDFTSEACNIQGKGRVRSIATGWVWFEYADKVDGHFKWTLNIDQTLPNVDDRSTFIEFRSAVDSTTKNEFKGACDA